MKNKTGYCTIVSGILALLIIGSALFAQTPDEFQKRRTAVLEQMDQNSILVLKSNDPAEGVEKYRQENNFYYLTGLSEPGTYLILKKGSTPSEIFFINERRAGSRDPDTLGLEGAKGKLGFTDVMESREFQSYLDELLSDNPKAVYARVRRSRDPSEATAVHEELFKNAVEGGIELTFENATSIINTMRGIKSKAEIEILQIAADITAEAQKEAMRTIRPGMYEYQLQSIIEHVYSINGAQRPGFSSIVGSGPNSCILHWSENSRKMESGDMVVVDIGAEYNMYTADITRSFPVNGKFTDHQREIYEIVLKANEEAIKMIAPGVSTRDLSDKASEVLAEGLMKVGLIKDRSELRQYYFHGLSHPIGLQVHDVGGARTLQPGMVITIEPGIYIREEGLGIRIEDDVLVTESGYFVMTKNVPKSVDEVEKMLSEDGLDFSRYLIKK